MADCGDYWNGFVPWFWRRFSGCGPSRSPDSLHVGGNCRLFVSTPNVHIQLISYFGKNVMLSWRDGNMGACVRNFPSLWCAPFVELTATLMDLSTAARWVDPALGFAVGWVSEVSQSQAVMYSTGMAELSVHKCV